MPNDHPPNGPDQRGPEPESPADAKPRRWTRRLLLGCLLLIGIWLLADLAYAWSVQRSVARWEASVERGEDGVRRGCEAYSLGDPSDTPLLMIHGISDSPHVYRKVAQLLAEEGAYCRCMRLAGFGESVEAYQQASIDDWLASVDQEVQRLRDNGQPVYIVAHSLGGAIALQYTLRHPKQVDALVLVAPAIEVSSDRSPLLPVRFWHSLLGWLLQFTQVTYSPFGVDALDPAEQVNDLRTPFLPTRVIDQVFDLIDLNRDIAPRIQVPVLMCLARQDHVIDNEAAQRFFEQLGSSRQELVEFPNSAHALLVDYQWRDFAAAVKDFITSL